MVDKACEAALPAPIRRVFYLSHEGDTHEHEVAPPPNPRVRSVGIAAQASNMLYLVHCCAGMPPRAWCQEL